MKTEEELDALNAEVEAGNEPLRELSDDDLSLVAGGRDREIRDERER